VYGASFQADIEAC
jgi:hypothetical protein